MNQVYVIKDWDDIYENNRSKEIKNPSWVPIPNKLYGDGYSLIMEHKDGASIYGAWIALVCIAQRCGVRGTLMRSNGMPHDIASISRITRIKQTVIKLMIDYSINPLKWLEIQDLQSSATISQESAAESQEGVLIQKDIKQKGKDRTEQKESFLVFWESYHNITKLSKTDKEATIKYWDKLSNVEWLKALEMIQPYYNSLIDKKYCKKARTYLSDKNFNDEFKPIEKPFDINDWKPPDEN